MKDIDFDELDKAVSSLMGSVKPEESNESSSNPVPVSSVSSQPTALPTPPPSVINQSDAVSSDLGATPLTPGPEVQPSAVRSIPPAVRRSGKFMDMVSTPNESRPRAAASAPMQAREGLTIVPRDDARTAAAAPSLLTESIETTDDGPQEVLEVTPDPSETETGLETVIASPDSSSSGPLESPFLIDAKVEKRPLNAGTPEPLVDLDFDNELESLSTSDEGLSGNESRDADEPPATPQVPELNSDLVAIESDDAGNDSYSTEPLVTAVADAAPATPLGATSIAQQYKTKESSGDQSHAAIYDSSQYPEPVSHPAKGKSGWLWVLWVLLLLAIGAGGAVVLYNLGIIP